MALNVEKTLQFNVPAHKVWQVIADFGGIEKFAPTIESSAIINSKYSGLGAKRRCVFYDGSSVVEEIVDLQQGQSITMVLSEYSMPLKSAVATMKVLPVNDNTSELTITMNFVVKAGPLGWLMGVVLMRPLMKGVFKKVLSGLAYHSATGKTVGNELPSEHELSIVFSG